MTTWRTAGRAIDRLASRYGVGVGRLALCVIYVWFGLLKVLDLSPATPLVSALAERTIPFVDFSSFIICFGLLEIMIGLLWLVRGWERLALAVMTLHLMTTALPLLLLPNLAWSQPLVPTLEGQYIIKNLALLAVGLLVVKNTARPHHT